jgi:hypothetical protein
MKQMKIQVLNLKKLKLKYQSSLLKYPNVNIYTYIAISPNELGWEFVQILIDLLAFETRPRFRT